MLEEALNQVTCTCRLPSVRDTFEGWSKLSPVVILNQISRHMFSELPFIHHAGNNVSKIEEQYRQKPFVDWKEETPFKKDGLPVDTEQFWIGVLQHKAFKRAHEWTPFFLPGRGFCSGYPSHPRTELKWHPKWNRKSSEMLGRGHWEAGGLHRRTVKRYCLK